VDWDWAITIVLTAIVIALEGYARYRTHIERVHNNKRRCDELPRTSGQTHDGEMVRGDQA
jgi:hypothetical protein